MGGGRVGWVGGGGREEGWRGWRGREWGRRERRGGGEWGGGGVTPRDVGGGRAALVYPSLPLSRVKGGKRPLLTRHSVLEQMASDVSGSRQFCHWKVCFQVAEKPAYQDILSHGQHRPFLEPFPNLPAAEQQQFGLEHSRDGQDSCLRPSTRRCQ